MHLIPVILSLSLIKLPVEGSVEELPSLLPALVVNETVEIYQDHRHVKRSAPSSAKAKQNIKHKKEYAYSLVLDPESNFRLHWTPDYGNRQVKFRIDILQLAPQAWFALGFSDRGDWPAADLCVAWENWKGAKIVQVLYVFLLNLTSGPICTSID